MPRPLKLNRSQLALAGVELPPPIEPASPRTGRKAPRASAPRDASGMGRWEKRYAQRLDALKLAGEVQEWHFEACRLVVARVVSADAQGKPSSKSQVYIPDFMVVMTDGTLEYHEVKGFMREDALLKIRVAAGLYPFVFRVARLVRGAWELEEVRGAG